MRMFVTEDGSAGFWKEVQVADPNEIAEHGYDLEQIKKMPPGPERDMVLDDLALKIERKYARGIPHPSGERYASGALKRLTYVDKRPLTRAAHNLDKRLRGTLDQPGAADRVRLRGIFRRVQELLETQYGVKINTADLQALLWYPEQRLWGQEKTRLTTNV